MLRRVTWLILFVISATVTARAQQDSLRRAPDTLRRTYRQHRPMTVLDSVAHAIAIEEQTVSDSLAMRFIKSPDSTQHSLFVDSILRANAYTGDLFLHRAKKTKRISQGYGHVRPARDGWLLVVIVVMLLFTAMLNIYSSRGMSNIFLQFTNKRTNAGAGKEESPIDTWTFIGLFLLFGFSVGLFLYLLTTGYSKVYYPISGVQLFFALSLGVVALFAGKFFILRFLGFVFDINKLVSEYIKTLSLTYFNITFVFLPVAVCFSLIADKFIPFLLAVTLLLCIVIFVWQYLRSSVGIISNIQFHKFYLFIYLCALEICPILILIKALNIGFR